MHCIKKWHSLLNDVEIKSWNKMFYSQSVWIGFNIELIANLVYRKEKAKSEADTSYVQPASLCGCQSMHGHN